MQARTSTNYIDSTDPRRMMSFLETIGAVTRPPTGNEREREGDRWDASPDYGQGDAYTNAPTPNYWAQYVHYMVYSLISWKKFARSFALYKFLLKLHKIAYTGIL